MDYEKHFHVDFTLSGCMEIRAINYYPSDCYVYEMRLEVSELTPDITTVIFDGVGLEFSCRKIAIIVSECPVERKVKKKICILHHWTDNHYTEGYFFCRCV